MRSIHLTRSAVLAGVIAAPLAVAAAPASHAAAGHGSAYAVSAAGPVAIPATPAVTSSGAPARRSVAELSGNPLVSASVLTAAAAAGRGRASVADLRIARAALTAEAVTVRCENGRAVAHLANAEIAGRRLQASPAPNSGVTVSLDRVGKVSLTLNKQVRNADGGLTVTAIALALPPVAGRSQTISIASVTCGPSDAAPAPTHRPSTPPDDAPPHDIPPSTMPSPNTHLPQAPAPTPVAKDLPVTG